jgi:hypothetical protein
MGKVYMCSLGVLLRAWNSIGDIVEVGTMIRLKDGQYCFRQIKELFNGEDHFHNEKHLCNYIEDNIEKFCEQIGIKYAGHKREAYFKQSYFGHGNKPRIDFLIDEENGGKVLLEVKKPKNIHREINMSISQLLDYYVMAEEAGIKINRAIILTTKCNDSFIGVIERFKLPVEVVLLSKKYVAIWEGRGVA